MPVQEPRFIVYPISDSFFAVHDTVTGESPGNFYGVEDEKTANVMADTANAAFVMGQTFALKTLAKAMALIGKTEELRLMVEAAAIQNTMDQVEEAIPGLTDGLSIAPEPVIKTPTEETA